GKKAQRVRNAQHDHLPIPERDEAVIEVGGRDRDVLTKAHRVVLVHPGVVARLCGSVLEALEARARVLVVREPFGAVVASCGGSIERTLAFTPIETDSVPFEPDPQTTPFLSMSPPRTPMPSFGIA